MKNLTEFFKNKQEASGTTAVTVHIQKNIDPRISQYMLDIAWAGDSHAIYARKDGSISFVTTDHKPTSPSEKDRIYKAGEYIMYGRVGGSLATARSIGAHD